MTVGNITDGDYTDAQIAHAVNNFYVKTMLERAEEKGVKSKDVDEVIEKLRQSGDIYEPRKGFISKI